MSQKHYTVDAPFDVQTYQARSGWMQVAIDALRGDGVEVFAPVEQEPGIVNLAPVTSTDEMAQEFVNVLTPLKALFLPRSEVLMEYERQEGGDVDLRPATPFCRERVVIGSRPCDAAALEVMDAVFSWDYDDASYLARREATTIVSWSCAKAGSHCFCASVGGTPHGTQGSDVLAFMSETGEALLCVLTEKGQRFVARLGDAVCAQGNGCDLPEPPPLELQFDPEKVKPWLDKNFDSDFWTGVSLKCLGCGICSFLCPTCHCFDIVDEASWHCGERRRNWDSCAFGLFTLHASGHNPRPDQSARCRQRVMHKFKYFPDRFDKVACVGCGRCIRNCGVGQNLVGILADITRLPQEDGG